MNDSPDAIVIGAGLAGLTAATHLGRAGHRVVLVDSRHRLGGRATTDDRNGFLVNQGAHALYRKGVGIGVLRELGIEPRGGVPSITGVGVRGDTIGPLASGLRTLLTTPLLRGRGRLELAGFVKRLPRVDTEAFDHTTVSDWLDHLTDRADVRDTVSMLIRLSSYANAPDRFSAGAALAQVQRSLGGVLYLHGGWQQLVDGLTAAATAAAVELAGGERVTSVSADGDSWLAQSSDRAWRAPVVVVAGLSPQAAAPLVGLDGDALLERAGPPVEAACLDLALDRAPRWNIGLGLDQPLYFSVHAPVADLAPAGKVAAVAMKYLPADVATNADDDRSELQAHAARMGAEAVIDQRFLARMTVTQGLPLARAGGLVGRPAVVGEDRPGVFLAGDWVGPEGMLADAALASGRAAALAAIAHLDERRVPTSAP
jgi:phytoene dehydrogenase-like protein